MVHRGIRNNSRVVYKLYIERGLLVLENLLLFSLYLFSCIAKQVTTLHSFDSCLICRYALQVFVMFLSPISIPSITYI